MDKIKNLPINLINILSISFLLFFLSACTVNDATGRSEFNIVSEEEELKLGKDADKVIRKQYGVYQDAALQNYIDQIGQRLVTVSGRNDIPYYFTVVDSPIINAFALPGGYIYVTRGILLNMNSESELAFVLGHEIAHVAARHGVRRLSQQRGIMAASVLADIVFKGGARKYENWVNAGVGLAVMGYGREYEFEADEFGAIYAFNASYHPNAYTDFFKTLLDQEKRSPTWMEGLLASHPPTKERIELVEVDIETLMEREQPDLSTFTTNKKEFLTKINGLVYGEGASLGVLSKTGRYKNKFFGLEIKLKDEWDIFETDSPDSLFTLEHIETKQQVTIHADYFPSSITLKSYVNKHYSKQGKLRSMILRQYPVKMHQFIHKYPNNNKDEQYQIQTYCVHQQFGYKVVGSTSYDDKGELAKFVDDVLKRLTFMVGPTHRLIVHSVKKGESLSQIAKRYMPLRKTAVEDLMSFNKLRSSNLEIGQLIKIPIEKETKSKKAY